MAQCLNIEDMNFSIEEDLPILLIKEYDVKSHIKGYHAYMNIWEPTIGEVLKALLEPENEFDKFAVAVEKSGAVVGHLAKGKSGPFAKTISFFLRANHENSCSVEDGKEGTLAMEKDYRFLALFILPGKRDILTN